MLIPVKPPFGRATAPVESVPTKFPSIRLPLVPRARMSIPSPALPETTFAAAEVVPPTVLFIAPKPIDSPGAKAGRQTGGGA